MTNPAGEADGVGASDQLEKASQQLKDLSTRASKAEADARAAKTKKKAELQAQLDAARAAAEQTARDLDAGADEVDDEITSAWTELQGRWKDHTAKIRKDADDAKSNLDAKLAERQAERAEARAEDALDFAAAAIEEAYYQVLNAAAARLDADDAAAEAS